MVAELADLPGIFPSTARHCKGFPFSKETLKTAQHSQEVLQQVATCVALVHGEEDPLAVDLLKQSAAKKKSVKALVRHYTTCTIVFKFNIGCRSGEMHSNCKKRVL